MEVELDKLAVNVGRSEGNEMRSQKKSYTKKGFFDMITYGHPVKRPKAVYVYI